MGAVAYVKDGQIVQQNTATSLANETSKLNKTGLDKDAFLGLLVAQMKYQDPLQPTSNTEFVSQYATFSELEQMQNMSSGLELSRASSLVGQIVSVNTEDSSGNVTQLQGKVDYVLYENNRAFVSIGGTLYSLDDVYGIADQNYLTAFDKASSFVVGMNKLPKKENLTLDHKDQIESLNDIYNKMSDYEKTFITKEDTDKLKEYTKRIEELVKDKAENDANYNDFTQRMGKLPKIEELTLSSKEEIDKLNELYHNMTNDQKNLVSKENADKLKEYTKRMEELAKA